MYYTIGTVSLTPILGSYLLSFFSNAAANDKYDTAIVGTVLNVLVVNALGFGFGFAGCGLVFSFISSRIGKARFYSDPTVSHGDTVEAELGADPLVPGEV